MATPGDRQRIQKQGPAKRANQPTAKHTPEKQTTAKQSSVKPLPSNTASKGRQPEAAAKEVGSRTVTKNTNTAQPTNEKSDLGNPKAVAPTSAAVAAAAPQNTPQPTTSAPAPLHKAVAPVPVTGKRKREEAESKTIRPKCSVCHRSFLEKNLVISPCSHAYCPRCLEQTLEPLLADESRFPLRCCQQIVPLAAAKLTKGFKKRLDAKQQEYNIPVASRLYCSFAKCSALLEGFDIKGSQARCKACKSFTCTSCKKKSHAGLCTQDEDDRKLQQLAKKKRWQHCSRCKRVIERVDGCNHMSMFLFPVTSYTLADSDIS